jgi:carbon storage regulator CsrA
MLVLSRKPEQEIVIGDNIKITVLRVKGNTVRLGIEAPSSIRVLRGELPVKPTEPMANVTIVIDDTMKRRRGSPGDSRSVASRVPASAAASSDGPKPDGVRSFNYRQRLPKVLEHNRLMQIAAELANNM